MLRRKMAGWIGGALSLAMMAALPAAAFAASPTPSQTSAGPSCAHLQEALRVAPHLGGDPDVQARAAACGIRLQDTSGKPQCLHLLAAVQLAPGLRTYPGVAARLVACSAPNEKGFTDQFFDDLSGYGWAQGAIDALAQLGIFRGEGAHHFQPAGHLTRAEFAALMDRLFHLPPPSTPETFVDVLPGYWAYSDIEAAAPYMSAFQVPGGTAFEPQLDITRIEVAATIGRIEVSENLAQLPSPAQAQAEWNQFTDGNQVPAGLMQYAAVALQMGFMQGYPNGSFGVDNQLTRAEAAVLLYRVLQSTETVGGSGTGGSTTQVTGYVVGDQTSSVVTGVYGSAGLAVSTYLLTPTTTVTVNGQTASVSTLPEGDAVTVTLNAANQPASVAAATPTQTMVTGVFQGAANGVATLSVGNATETVPVGASPVVVDNERVVDLGALTVGATATVDEYAIYGSALIVTGA